MQTYLVSAMQEDKNGRRRVVLDTASHGDVLQSIQVDSSGDYKNRQLEYMEARSRVNETGFYHDPCYGWFLS